MRIRVDSIGCRLNISEVEEMARSFVASGHRLVGPGEVADLCVFNTCTVTNMAARKSRKIIRQMRRANPHATLVVTGCYADLSPQEMTTVGADFIVDNQDKDRLPEILAEQNILRDADPIPAVDTASFINPVINSIEGGHTRAFIKVQDGCDNRCTFCIVTVARGAGRSRSLADVLAEVNRLTMLGYQEAVLSGVHLGSYGHDQGQTDGLYQLIKTILAETDLPRLRLSSLEPWDLTPDFFELWDNQRLLPHLHLPLQSGCDATLRRMARRTSQVEFAALLKKARTVIPDVGISTDIIVGFPGETEAEFADSISFVEAMGFSKLHIFRYSRREGTAAAKMRGQVHGKTVQERSQQMHILGARLEEQFRQKFVGRTMPVLWEGNEPFGFGLNLTLRWSGLTGNYLRVVTQTASETNLRNQVTPTQLVDVALGALQGQIDSIK
ncbi:tRNA (N(6)-L-threonylcarbamoyladenosine(37)-C(2))-methylthiotransferase MtaB [Anaerolineales bacterium HSG24]|nr:tRNA (N(6)-L-threonylcarbamoyladenosine(37)-C(2))-methylthiotransferase MtaB [Anaerolineales bacterium HSG24]